MNVTIGSRAKDDVGYKYILDDLLGSGGFGNVFKAYREKDNAIFTAAFLLPIAWACFGI